MSIFLISNCLAMPVFVPPEEIAVGQVVFQHFLHDEFEQEGMDDYDLNLFQAAGEPNANEVINANLVVPVVPDVDVLEGSSDAYRRVVVAQIGNNLRELANEFAQSRQRQDVRREADEVDLSALTREGFWLLLEELFQHGITRHNLVALFFFCSDVLIRCARMKLRDLGFNLFKWVLNYIAERVVRWVVEKGGWEKALKAAIVNTRDYVFTAGKHLATAGVCVGIAAIAYFSIRKIF